MPAAIAAGAVLLALALIAIRLEAHDRAWMKGIYEDA